MDKQTNGQWTNGQTDNWSNRQMGKQTNRRKESVDKERNGQSFFMIKIPPFQAKLGSINKDVDKRIWRRRRKNGLKPVSKLWCQVGCTKGAKKLEKNEKVERACKEYEKV